MKIIGISILIMVLLIGLNFGLDIIQGFNRKSAVYNAISPFRVGNTLDYIVVFLFILFIAIDIILYHRKQKQEAISPQNKKQS
ncbi:high-affinity nickel permease [Peribacillus huizhouensis]|uniref:High-affinity nickel permease n=1 Tax=Peribacillus huizhouensis TaxID=1501239 RepID=A0ABR6CTB2_9BACI|nr:high-affinity nickel permease [Peribacillus huizhouensis]